MIFLFVHVQGFTTFYKNIFFSIHYSHYYSQDSIRTQIIKQIRDTESHTFIIILILKRIFVETLSLLIVDKSNYILKFIVHNSV